MNEIKPTATALPEKYRKATSIKEGYEVLTGGGDGVWKRIVSRLYITAPIGVIDVQFSDGTRTAFPPSLRIMSRRPADGAAAETTIQTQDFVLVHCPWLDGQGDDPETFARVEGDQAFCDACGATDHEVVGAR